MRILRIVLAVIVVTVVALVAGTVVAQIGLRAAPEIFTTLIGTAVVSGVMIGIGLWVALSIRKWMTRKAIK